jgi:DNA-binding CsgD family transcriptional regulator
MVLHLPGLSFNPDELLNSTKANAFLEALVLTHGLANAAYLAHTIPGRGPEDPIVWATYSAQWIAHYIENDYIKIDPVVALDKTSVVPVDWQSIDKSSPLLRRFFGEATEFGVGRNGLAIPVRGPRGDRSIFVVTSNDTTTEWEKKKRVLVRDLVLVSQYVHQQAMTEAGVYRAKKSEVKLAPREAECLRWAAAGKTVPDIAVILSISERVTRGYLDTARHKLNASNVAHAVGRAVSLGLIAPDWF